MSCPNCIEGYLLPGEPRGKIEPDFQGAYHAGPEHQNLTTTSANSNATLPESKRTIVFLTDGFGLPLKNCKIMADELSRRLECDVWVPDYFDGRPLVRLEDMNATPDTSSTSQKRTVVDWVKFTYFKISNLPAFIHSRPFVVDRRVTSFISLLKKERGYKKIGIVGYCYGGAAAIRFAGTDLINTAVICHPGPSFPIHEVHAIRVPTSWACAEVDVFWPHSKRLEVEEILAGRKDKPGSVGAAFEYEFRDYKGTAHGFAIRPNLDSPEIKEAHEHAFEQTVEWFKKTLV